MARRIDAGSFHHSITEQSGGLDLKTAGCKRVRVEKNLMADLPSKCPTCSYDLSGLHSGKCPECGVVSPLGRSFRRDGDFDLLKILAAPWISGMAYIGSVVLLVILWRTNAVDPAAYKGSEVFWILFFLFALFVIAVATFVLSILGSARGTVHHGSRRRRWAIASMGFFLFNAIILSADAFMAFAMRV